MTILMKNPPGPVSVKHGIAVDGNGVAKDGKIVGPGGSSVSRSNSRPASTRSTARSRPPSGVQGTLTVT